MYRSASEVPGYLLITHVPFVRDREGRAWTDGLWARDLEGLLRTIGPFRVAAPDHGCGQAFESWGPTTSRVDERVTFVSLPRIQSRRHLVRWIAIRRILDREVRRATVVHTSNLFPPYRGLAYAQRRAERLGKKTLLVIAEDFYDMLQWEWVRTGSTNHTRRRRQRQIDAMDRDLRRRAATATTTFLHTPASVRRYRAYARDGHLIRQPGHERADVATLDSIERRRGELCDGFPLRVLATCRHSALKGLDHLIDATAICRRRGLDVRVTLLGSGAETDGLKSLAHRRNVADFIEFAGVLPPGEAIYAALQSAHVSAMPHRTTDFGRAFFDAMTGATPVVAYRTDASEETLRHEVDGTLIPLDDVESLAFALQHYARDPDRWADHATRARRRALENTRSFWFDLRADWIRRIVEPP